MAGATGHQEENMSERTERLEEGEGRAARLAVGIVGLSALLSSDWCMNLTEVATGASYSVVVDAAFRLSFALCCALCAVLSRRRAGKTTAARGIRVCTLVCLFLGQGLYVFVPILPVPSAFRAIGGVVCGAACAFTLLWWIERICDEEPRRVAVALSASYLLTGATFFILASLASAVAAVVIALLPLASGLLLKAYDEAGGTSRTHGSQGRPEADTNWAFPVYPVVLMAAFKLVFNFSLSFSLGASIYGPLGIICASALALAYALFAKEGFNPTLLFKLALPCMVAGLLMISWVRVGAGVATLFSNAGNIAFELFSLMVMAEACRRWNIKPMWVFGILEAASYASTCAGKILGGLFTAAYPGGTFESSAVMTVAVVALVTLCTFFPSERLALRTFGDAGESKGLVGVELMCATVSRRYGLSRREEEVLGLLVQQMSAAQIGEELAISRSTVKSHVRHIYEKTGVHSREELEALVASGGRPEAAG